MKTLSMIIITLLLMVVFAMMSYTFSHKQILSLKNKINTSWTPVENHLHSQFELIPDIIKAVKAYIDHDKQGNNRDTEKLRLMINALSELDNRRNQANDRPENTMRSQEQLNLIMNQFISVARQHPDLLSFEQFSSLQAELESREKRFTIARAQYNRYVEQYNASIKRFPGHFIAEKNNLKPQIYMRVESKQITGPE